MELGGRGRARREPVDVRAMVRRAGFPVWAVSGDVGRPRLYDVAGTNGRAQSVTLEWRDIGVVVKSRFRMATDDEPAKFEEFAGGMLTHLTRHYVLDAEATDTIVNVGGSSWTSRSIGYGVVGATRLLEVVGFDHAAVDIASIGRVSTLTLIELDGAYDVAEPLPDGFR